MSRYEWLDGCLCAKAGCVKDFKEAWGWWRWCVGGKMFAAICRPGPSHRDYAGKELLTLKCEPLLAELLRGQYPDVFPGFYMDKRNWISVCLEGDVPDELLRELCDRSYALVFGGLSKKLQRELEAAPHG